MKFLASIFIVVAAAAAFGQPINDGDPVSTGTAAMAIETHGVVTQAPAPPPAPAPTPDPNSEAIESNIGVHVEPFSEVVHLMAGGTATVAGLRVPVTPRFSIVASQYMVPGAHSTYTIGEAEFRERLDHLIKSKSVLIPLNAIQIWGRGGLGSRRADGVKPELAYSAQGGLSLAVGKVAGGTLVVDLRGGYLGSGVLNSPRTHFLFSNTGDAALGLSVKF